VIRFHDVLEDEWHYYLVTEYMVSGLGREGERKRKREGLLGAGKREEREGTYEVARFTRGDYK